MAKKRKRSSDGESNPHYSISPLPLARASTTCAIEDTTSISVNLKKKKCVFDERVSSHAGVFRGGRLWGGIRFLLFLVRLKTSNSAAELSAYVFVRKRSANQRKKVQC